MTIHWHGIYQNGTQFMDGVPGISQVSPTSGDFSGDELSLSARLLRV
jgi:hypothetical protein